ncbi:hypothetical protein [Brevundimonas diminuta]|uniref:hypothetical protein n=1 Tax=Brevundimonas diminuta TaxID=293 RepID=UPI003D04BCB1
MVQVIGKSTTVIANLFGLKVGLIDAVNEVALAQDEAFHREFFACLDHLPPGRDALIGVILSYLKVRSSPQVQGARVRLLCQMRPIDRPDMTGDQAEAGL